MHCRCCSELRKAHGLEELRDIKKAVTATAAAFAPPDVSAPGALEVPACKSQVA